MAELKSLARVVKHAEAIDRRRSDLSPSTTLLYLLDEILQGTNSRERQIAVAHVLRHLIDRGAIGAISTHDLELADDPQLQRLAHTVHFRETITRDDQGRDQMTFDYRMRQGVSPTTNALRLLEVVGLGKPDQTI
jgi:DNA mismatch repair ATPase MutS